MRACACLRECVYAREREIETVLRGFCVIVLSAEACREKGHVLSSEHIVYYNHNRGGEIERQKGVIGKKGGRKTPNEWVMERGGAERE